ncbi:MAG: ABC transporter ATP-binding protein [Desulfatirhabdiaceae bacterium]
MISIHNLTKNFGRAVAVDHVTLEVPPGEIFGFIGPNGAGKTTTIRMMTGLLYPSDGTVQICGVDMIKNPVEAKQRIGLIPDRPYLYEKLTGMEFLRFMGDMYRVKPADFMQKARDMLAQFSLLDRGNELIEAYSHGMKQRLIMCAALIHDPDVIIVDEPMVGLDPRGIKMVRELFRILAGNGRTVFMSTHTLKLAQEICDRIGIIHQGKLIATGTLMELEEQASMSGSDLESIFFQLTEPLEPV